MPLSTDTKRRMEAFLAVDHHGKGSKHRYSLADYGLAEADIEAAFGDYIDRFGVTRERR